MDAAELYDRYADLRREGFDGWAASVELGLLNRQSRAFAARFKLDGRERRPAREEPRRQEARSAGIKPDATPLRLSEEPPRWDDEHVGAVLRQGGYPRAAIAMKRGKQSTVWLGIRGLWKHGVAA